MEFVDPHTTLLQLGLRDGMRVGDFGTGSGHYALAASAMVGNEGRVYAVDIQEDVIKRLQDDAERAGKNNINFIWGNLEKAGSTKLKEGALDAIVLSNTLFQLEDAPSAIAEMKRVLKGGGKILLVDWSEAHGGMGPAGEFVMSEEKAERLFTGAGFSKVKSFRAGPHHYAMVFTI
jgi:ubiquinone/menaquinone biosynthesis C-methylase UbiE